MAKPDPMDEVCDGLVRMLRALATIVEHRGEILAGLDDPAQREEVQKALGARLAPLIVPLGDYLNRIQNGSIAAKGEGVSDG